MREQRNERRIDAKGNVAANVSSGETEHDGQNQAGKADEDGSEKGLRQPITSVSLRSADRTHRAAAPWRPERVRATGRRGNPIRQSRGARTVSPRRDSAQ